MRLTTRRRRCVLLRGVVIPGIVFPFFPLSPRFAVPRCNQNSFHIFFVPPYFVLPHEFFYGVEMVLESLFSFFKKFIPPSEWHPPLDPFPFFFSACEFIAALHAMQVSLSRFDCQVCHKLNANADFYPSSPMGAFFLRNFYLFPPLSVLLHGCGPPNNPPSTLSFLLKSPGTPLSNDPVLLGPPPFFLRCRCAAIHPLFVVERLALILVPVYDLGSRVLGAGHGYFSYSSQMLFLPDYFLVLPPGSFSSVSLALTYVLFRAGHC